MITEHELQEAIAECEGQRNPSANTCLKLAAFYTIRDKMYPSERNVEVEKPSYSYSRSAGPMDADTEFLQAVARTDQGEFLLIMDELMSTLQTIMPRLYDGVMRKLIN